MITDHPINFGSYRLQGRLGRGAMGVVYSAVDTRDDRKVALKVMLADIASDEGARVRFIREAEAVARLQHRNIVTVLDWGVFDDAPYIAMELLEGVSLAERLSKAERVSLHTKLSIVIQLCEGLQFAHDCGIVHRDVKPANVWLLKNGGVKLLDFGIAKIAGSTLTRAGGIVGNAAYMSPEQLAGGDIDGRADIFAAGGILYELLTGHRAFEADSITAVMHKILHEEPKPVRTLAPDIPRDLESIVEIAMHKNPSERYEQASEFGTELRLAQYQLKPIPNETVIVRRPSRQTDAPHSKAPAEATPEKVGADSPPKEAVSTSPRPLVEAPPGPPPAPVAESFTPKPANPSPVVNIAKPASENEEPVPTKVAATLESLAGLIVPLVRSYPVATGAVATFAVVAIVLVARAAIGSSSPAPTFQLDVQSTPPGAAISFDGRETGQRTPATVVLSAWPGRIALTLTGYQGIEAVIPPESSERSPLSYRLRRLLKIASEPAGARILFDGRDTGQVTPAEIAVTDPPPANIDVQLSERVRRSTPMTAALLESGELRVAFPSKPGKPPVDGPKNAPPGTVVSVRVTGGYPFEVVGCGENSPAATEHSLQVTAPCTLRLRAPAYFLDTSRAIEASSGQVEIGAPQLARVELRTRYEWCTVILAGHAVGSPPVEVELAAGTYTATIQCPDKTLSTKSFSIDPGRSTRRLDEFLR